MELIKIDAIGSTNVYLKSLVTQLKPKQALAVRAVHQFSGRGQGNNRWVSAKGKNLTCSLYFPQTNCLALELFNLNKAISLCLLRFLKTLKIPNLSIKWPNDILSANQKIAGLLIEPSIQQHHISSVIVGIGLNINQLAFEHIPHATSLQCITGMEYNIDDIFKALTLSFDSLFDHDLDELEYHQELYQFEQKSKMKLNNGPPFEATIKGVSKEGLLCIEDTNGIQKSYGHRELQLLYVMD